MNVAIKSFALVVLLLAPRWAAAQDEVSGPTRIYEYKDGTTFYGWPEFGDYDDSNPTFVIRIDAPWLPYSPRETIKKNELLLRPTVESADARKERLARQGAEAGYALIETTTGPKWISSRELGLAERAKAMASKRDEAGTEGAVESLIEGQTFDETEAEGRTEEPGGAASGRWWQAGAIVAAAVLLAAGIAKFMVFS